MTRKTRLCSGLLCIGLAIAISSPSHAGWGSFGGSSFGSGGSSGFGSSGGASHGAHGWGSHGSGGSSGGSLGSYRAHRVFPRHHGSSGGSFGSSFGSALGSHGSSGGHARVVVKAHGSSGGGSFGGSVGSLGASHGSSGGSSGGLFHGGLISKLKDMHQKKMSWLRSRGHGSSGGSSGHSFHHGSSGGSSGGSSHGGSFGGHVPHGSHGSHGSYGFSTPISTSLVASSIVPAAVEPTNVQPAYEGSSLLGSLVSTAAVYSDQADTKSDKGTLVVALPAAAKLFVNGQPTTSTGDSRQFVSQGLQSGYRYPYTVKAVLDVDGKEVVRTKTVDLRAGDSVELAFEFAAAATTNLTIRVPEGASVELAGAKTNASGAERQFATTKLATGQVWEDYAVVVTLDGVSKTQTIDLRGGENRTLTFDFGQVAAR